MLVYALLFVLGGLDLGGALRLGGLHHLGAVNVELLRDQGVRGLVHVGVRDFRTDEVRVSQ